MSVGRIGTRVVATATPGESLLEVAQRMDERNVGCVVVVDPKARPVGIVTDRDIVTRLVAKELDPARTHVSQVMTGDVRTVDESTPIEEAVATMGDAGARRLAITGRAGKLVGILSMDDVVELLAEEAQSIGRLLRKEAPTLSAST